MTEAVEQVAPPDPFRVIKGIQPAAWKMLVYGVPGVGKSSFAAFAPSPIFLDLENGLGRIDCVKTPHRLQTLDEVMDWLRWFVRAGEYKTVVIDTIDELERLLATKVVEEWNRNNAKVKTVSDIPYGRGGDLLVNEWRQFMQIFEYIYSVGKNVLLIGHEQVIKFENPTDANYDFYTVNIHKKSAPVVTAKLDAVLFARFETVIKSAKDGKGKAVTTGDRVLYTTQGASWVAKNRFRLDGVVPMDESLFEKIV